MPDAFSRYLAGTLTRSFLSEPIPLPRRPKPSQGPHLWRPRSGGRELVDSYELQGPHSWRPRWAASHLPRRPPRRDPIHGVRVGPLPITLLEGEGAIAKQSEGRFH